MKLTWIRVVPEAYLVLPLHLLPLYEAVDPAGIQGRICAENDDVGASENELIDFASIRFGFWLP